MTNVDGFAPRETRYTYPDVEYGQRFKLGWVFGYREEDVMRGRGFHNCMETNRVTKDESQ